MFWDYNKYFERPVPEKFWLPGYDEMSPVYLLQDRLSNTWIKDESVHPTGTHKDRSFRYWVSYLWSQDVKEAVISSSGNAARSAKYYCDLAGIKLHVFTKETGKTPKKDAMALSKEKNIPHLRASTEDEAIEGYKTLAFEISEQCENIEEIFLPVSSGAALQGLFMGYKILEKNKGIFIPRLYIVQTTMVHPMAESFDKNFVAEENHTARAIIDRIAHRKSTITNMVKDTRGGGYIISKMELDSAPEDLTLTKINPGKESLLTIAALKKHRERNPEYSSAKSICIFTN